MSLIESYVFRIKPALETFLRSPTISNLKTLENELEKSNWTYMNLFDAQVLIPLVLKLDELSNDDQDLRTACLECITTVLSKTYLKQLSAIRTVLVVTLKQIRHWPQTSIRPDLSEEIKVAAIKCIIACLKRSTSDVLEQFYSKECIVILGQTLLTLVEFIEYAKYKQLVIIALECLMVVFYVYDDADQMDVVMRNQVANTLFMFLPKVVTVLYKLALGDEKLNEIIKVISIKALGRILTITFEETTENLVQVRHDAAAFKELLASALSDNINGQNNGHHSMLNKLAAKNISARPEVQLKELQNEGRSQVWIQVSSKSVLALTEDVDFSIRSLCRRSIDEMQNTYGIKELFDENADLLFEAHLTKMPRIISRCDDNEQFAEFSFIKGFFNSLTPKKLYSVLTVPRHMEIFCACLLDALALRTSFDFFEEEDGYLLNRISSNFDFESRSQLFWRKFKNLTSRRCVSILQSICGILGRTEILNQLLIDYLMEMLTQNDEAMNEIILVILWLGTIEEKPLHSNKLNLVSQFIEELLNDRHWCLALEPDNLEHMHADKLANWLVERTPGLYESGIEIRTQSIDSDDEAEESSSHFVTTTDAQYNVLHTCMILDALGHCALKLGEKFDIYIFRSLHKILIKIADKNEIVARAAMFSLTSIQKALKFLDLPSLIETHIDYIGYHLNIALKRAPNSKAAIDIITVLLHFSSRNSIPYLENVFEIIYEQFSESQNHVNCNAYLKVFKAFLFYVSKWLLDCDLEIAKNLEIPGNNGIDKENEENIAIHWLNMISSTFARETMTDSENCKLVNDNIVCPPDLNSTCNTPTDNCLPKHLEMVKTILYQVSKTLTTKEHIYQIMSLDCLIIGIPLLKDYDDILLPLAHYMWKPLTEKFRQRNMIITIRSLSVLVVLAESAKDFITKRALDEVIPLLKIFLQNSASHSVKFHSGGTQSYKMQVKLLQEFANLIISLNIDVLKGIAMDELANDTQHQSNEIPGNTSMDEQKMDGKEKSLEEDILGSENLRMSDSDVSNDLNSPVDRANENWERLLTKKQEKENMINEINVLKRVPNKKVMRLIDSDTEDEECTIQWGLKNNEMEIQKILPKKPLLLVDTHTEESLKASQPPNSDDSNSEVSRYNIKHIKKRNKTVKSRDKENTEKSDSADVKQKYSALIDSDSDSDNRILEFGENHIESEVHISDNAESKNKKGSKTGPSYKRENVMRASAKKALDEMQAIQSEQQRLRRETHVSIPYHKPKKRTLEEFLKRRTIVKPQLTNVENSPVAALVQAKSLKMTSEELEEYAKLMEERAKEAIEFFKSESENESEFVHNSGVLGKLPTMQEQLDKQVEIKSSTKGVANGKACNTQEILNNEIEILEKPKDNSTAVQRSEEILCEVFDENLLGKSPAKVVITEVIELPKLDMNTIHGSPAKLESLVKRTTFHNVKELLEKKYLPRNPSLSGDPSKLINLETGDLMEKQPNGVENLMQRLMSTVKVHKTKTLERCNILAFENDKLKVTSVNVNIHGDESSIKKEPKPGAAYFELKKNLKEIIKKKRLEKLCKKREEEKMEYEESSIDTEEEDCGDFEDENEIDEFSKDEGKEKKEILADIDVTEELEIEEEDQIDVFEERKMNKIQEEETFDLERKKHAANFFADSSGYNDDLEINRDDIDFLKTQPLSESPLALRTQTEKEELLTICSGSFDSTQPTTSALISQIPLVQNNVEHMNEDELLQLCSGRFDGESETQKLQNEENNSQLSHKSVCNNILSSDEDNDDEEEEPVRLSRGKPRKKKLTKRINKKKAKLGFSDDEEEEEITEDRGSDLEDKIDATEPEVFIDYDSEENEILVHLTKDERVQEAEKFFENEAELSESDWGSADEDEENDLDKYDIELGDEDEFDKEKLRDELGKIHARKMLDEDIKEVRKFQEMFLEDEENDGVGRQRQFKWRNVENGLTLEDMQRAEIDRDDNGNNSDDPNEHEWRKIRYEREQFLKDKGLKLDSQDASTNLAQPKLPAIVTVSPYCKKLQVINAKKSSAYAETNPKTSSPFLISKGVNLITMNRRTARGSFLVRDKETLDKLAGLNKGKSGTANVGDMDGGTAAISVNTAKAKNFVFATLTEEEHESLKRKADNLLNSSNENGVNYMKKPKFEPRRDKCFIDQLL
uniref:Uncharacterized protein n=1 Tax=Glossina morsitans morsitans TaxID=37546 RepID=A0A1B0FFV9_GLOMM